MNGTLLYYFCCLGSNDLQMEHAGFLLALGLNGHLKNLAINSTFNYLEKLHEMTSVGILLGKLKLSRREDFRRNKISCFF